jgi:hypothetical protein
MISNPIRDLRLRLGLEGLNVSTQTEEIEMNRANKRSRSRLGGLLVLALGIVALLAIPAGAAAKDRNHDRIPDRWEKRHHLSLNVNQAGRDQDGDDLRNRSEFRAGDNPRDDDSDDDGVMDGDENAGTISSFDATSGKLTIALFGGDSISGIVDSTTEIKCEGPDDNSGEAVRSRSGEEEPGDDHGGRGEEELGDDHGGGDNSGPGSDNSGPGSSGADNSGHNGDDDNDGRTCTIAELVTGAVVQEADLHLENGTATFDEVELAH